jgi:AcrR family transcriptional regulator
MASPKPDARYKVLEAAVAIVAREGAAHLTIDAVAAQAGLSKGGVLYHFPSKRALLDGMLERLLDDSETRSAYHRQQTGSRLAGNRALRSGPLPWRCSPTRRKTRRCSIRPGR